MDHGLSTFAGVFLVTTLGRRVGAFQLEFLARSLQVFAAVGSPENRAVWLDVEGVRDDLISGDDVLFEEDEMLVLFCVFSKNMGKKIGRKIGDKGLKKKKKKSGRNCPASMGKELLYIRQTIHTYRVNNHFGRGRSAKDCVQKRGQPGTREREKTRRWEKKEVWIRREGGGGAV